MANVRSFPFLLFRARLTLVLQRDPAKASCGLSFSIVVVRMDSDFRPVLGLL
jgi:hypothetical protein